MKRQIKIINTHDVLEIIWCEDKDQFFYSIFLIFFFFSSSGCGGWKTRKELQDKSSCNRLNNFGRKLVFRTLFSLWLGFNGL